MSRVCAPRAYGLAGLRIISDLPLPGGSPFVLMGSRPVARSRSDARPSASRFLTVAATFPCGQCNETELLLKIPGVVAGICCVTATKSL